MVARLVRDQKVAGSNPVTSTKILSEDYNLQAFLLSDFARFSLRNPLFPEQIRIPADRPLFGFNRMTTDKGGCVELRVWFRGAFSVRDVHWQKGVEKGRRDEKKGALVLKVHDRSIFTHLHLESILPAHPHVALPHHPQAPLLLLTGFREGTPFRAAIKPAPSHAKI